MSPKQNELRVIAFHCYFFLLNVRILCQTAVGLEEDHQRASQQPFWRGSATLRPLVMCRAQSALRALELSSCRDGKMTPLTSLQGTARATHSIDLPPASHCTTKQFNCTRNLWRTHFKKNVHSGSGGKRPYFCNRVVTPREYLSKMINLFSVVRHLGFLLSHLIFLRIINQLDDSCD